MGKSQEKYKNENSQKIAVAQREEDRRRFQKEQLEFRVEEVGVFLGRGNIKLT